MKDLILIFLAFAVMGSASLFADEPSTVDAPDVVTVDKRTNVECSYWMKGKTAWEHRMDNTKPHVDCRSISNF